LGGFKIGKAKIIFITIAIIIILVLLGGFLFYRSLTKSETREAFLSELKGNVLVDQGEGWKAATAGIDLYANDKIKTEDGSAVVVLQESVLITLKSKTEVEIKDLGKENLNVKQNSGTTWNKFTGLTGVESYKIETPNTVAAVRGTGWELTANDEGDQIIVGDGTVDYTYNEKEISVNALEKYTAEGKELNKGVLTGAEKTKIKEYLMKDLETLRKLRWDEINKNKKLYEFAKKKFNFDDAKVQAIFDYADKEEINEDEINIPIKTEGVYKMIAISKKIREILKLIENI